MNYPSTSALGIFTVEDVLEAIESTNYDKAIGCDGFDGSVLKMSLELKNKMATEIAKSLNEMSLPSYL